MGIKIILASSLFLLVGSVLLFTNQQNNTIGNSGPTLLPGEFNLLKTSYENSIQNLGAEAAYKKFKQEAEEVSPRRGHVLMHIFGETLYEAGGVDNLTICDGTASFGCFHAVMGLAFEGAGALTQLDNLCLGQKDETSRAECQHGMGHGILTYVGKNNIEKALEMCSTLLFAEGAACANGAFMEYFLFSIDDPSVDIILNPKDLSFSCEDILPVRFQSSCQIQKTHWWVELHEGDFPHVISLCNQITDAAGRFACFYGVGRYSVLFDQTYTFPKVNKLCESMPNEVAQKECKKGARSACAYLPFEEKNSCFGVIY